MIICKEGVERRPKPCKYRGHNYKGICEVHIDKQRRGKTPKSLWKWMKRRAAVEPGIGHLKKEHRMDRCRLKGIEADQINAVLSAAGMNFGKLLKAVSLLPSYLRRIFALLIETALRPLRLQPACDRPDEIMLLV